MNDPYSYYKDDNGNIKYNELCEQCDNECKQSFRSKIMACPKLKEKRKNRWINILIMQQLLYLIW